MALLKGPFYEIGAFSVSVCPRDIMPLNAMENSCKISVKYIL